MSNGFPDPSSKQSPTEGSFQQKLLEKFYNDCSQKMKELSTQFSQELGDLYHECDKRLASTVRELNAVNDQLIEKDNEIERLRLNKRRTAREVMDRIGMPLARLYSDIDKLPEEETCKADLLKDLEVLDGAFKNCGITQIDKLPNQSNSETHKFCGDYVTSDEKLINKYAIQKVGFFIENENLIPAEYVKYVAEKQPEKQPEKKPEENPSQKYPFQYNTDFIIYWENGQPILRLKSKEMCDALFNLDVDSDLSLNKYYNSKNQRMVYRDPVNQRDFEADKCQIQALKIDAEGNGELILFLYFYPGGLKPKEIKKFSLAYLPYNI